MKGLRLFEENISPDVMAAQVISFFTNPVVVVMAAILIITNHYAPNFEKFWHWFGAALLLLAGPSFFYVGYTWNKERKVDIDITSRQDRIVPMVLTSLGAVVGSHLVQERLSNPNMTLMANILAILIVALTLVTLVWKISLHATTVSAITTLLIFFGGWWYALLFIVLLPVGWARMKLRQHTLAQIVAGTASGVTITVLCFVLFR